MITIDIYAKKPTEDHEKLIASIKTSAYQTFESVYGVGVNAISEDKRLKGAYVSRVKIGNKEEYECDPDDIEGYFEYLQWKKQDKKSEVKAAA